MKGIRSLGNTRYVVVTHISFFCNKNRAGSDCSELINQFLLLLFLYVFNSSSNFSIFWSRIHISKYPFILYNTSSHKDFLYEKDVYIILCFILKYKRTFDIFTYFSKFILLYKYIATWFCWLLFISINLAITNRRVGYLLIFT